MITADFLHPFVLGSSTDFAVLRKVLLDADYSEKSVCERSRIDSIFEFEIDQEQAYRPAPFRDRLDLLLRMLMHGHLARERDLQAVLEDKELEILENLGVFARSPDDPSLLYATAALYPVENVYVASDRSFPPLPGWSTSVPSDVVFAAITTHTRGFLGSIPRDKCENLLDLCAGSGIAALLGGANFAKRACAADLGERCVHFSEFSRRLNGLENVSTAQGDLYNAVPGQIFDRIVAHPPYIPSKQNAMLFRDGGEDGEQVFRRVIEGLPEFLAPRGRLHCVTFATDRKSGALEDRVRAWLGPEESDFDVIIVASEMRSRPLGSEIERQTAPLTAKADETVRTFERLGVTALFQGSVMVQRKASGRVAFSARTLRSPNTPFSAAEKYRQVTTALYSEELAAHAATIVPRMAPGLRVIVSHKSGPDGLVPTEYSLSMSYPWIANEQTESWVTTLLSYCDGNSTLSEIFEQLRVGGLLDDDASPAELWSLIRHLSVNGYLQIGYQTSSTPA